MKTKKALLNVLINLIVQVLNVVLTLAVRRSFSVLLGNDILGLNSLYSSILAFLALSELGIGSCVSMCLYKPLADSDSGRVSSYMAFLKHIYYFIGLAILFVGLLIIPFLHLFINGNFNQSFISISFSLYLISTASTYFFSYKKTLLGADQLSYILSASQAVYKIVLNVGQYAVLIFTHSYYLFLIVAIVCNFSENYIVSLICDKKYPYLKEKAVPLSKNDKKDVGVKVTGVLCYKIGNYFIEGTDNIIISAVLGTVVVAYYNNYYLIINLMYAIFANFATSSVAGMGNILYTEKEKLNGTLKRLLMVQQYVFSFSAVAFMALSTFFVKTVFPTSELFDLPVIMLMVAVYYIKGYSEAIESVRNCAGVYDDKYVNLTMAVLNVVVSYALVGIMGVSGVLIGTLLCYSIKELIVVPRIVFNKVLERGRIGYYVQTLKNVCLTVIEAVAVSVIATALNIDSWIKWLLAGALSLAVTFLINTLFYYHTAEYRDMRSYVVNLIHRNIERK